MSAPAEKNLPVPVSTIALMPGSALAAAKASAKATRSACPSALTGGLCMRMTAISPSVSVSTMATVRSPYVWHGSMSGMMLAWLCRHWLGCRPRLGAGLRPRLLFRHQAYQGGTAMLRGLMMDRPLLVSSVIDYAADVFPDVEVVSQTIEGGLHGYGYAQARQRIGRLANALLALGVKPGDRVATLAWNGYRHFELYFAIAGIGAVCHTINPRLFPDQIAYIANHAADSVLFSDLTFHPL